MCRVTRFGRSRFFPTPISIKFRSFVVSIIDQTRNELISLFIAIARSAALSLYAALFIFCTFRFFFAFPSSATLFVAEQSNHAYLECECNSLVYFFQEKVDVFGAVLIGFGG